MKKINALILVALLLVLPMASAYTVSFSDEEVDTSNYPADNFLGRFFSSIVYEADTFTVYGDALGCDKFVSEENRIEWSNVILARTVKITTEPGDAVLVNWFRGSPDDAAYSDHPEDSRQFMGEIYLEHGVTEEQLKLVCDAGAYWDYECYAEVYECPNPCYKNLDCPAGSECDTTILSGSDSPFPNGAGVCMVLEPVHKTKVYECFDGEKSFLGEVEYGDQDFCTNPEDSKYLIGTTDQCLDFEPSSCSQTGEETFLETTPLKEVGEFCDNDIECASSNCEDGLIKGKCQPVPWSEIKKLSLTEDQLQTITAADALSAACLRDSECFVLDEEKYEADCISLDQLKDEGMVPWSPGTFFEGAQSVLEGTLKGVKWGGIIGGAVCVVGGTALIATGAGAVGVAPLCSAALTGGLVTGGAIGSVSTLSENDEIVKELQDENGKAVGLCVATEDKSGLEDITGWAALFDITGDDGVDGLIIIFGALLILYFFFGVRRY